MGRRIKLWQDPHGNGALYKKKSITFKPGLTVLVGCNGVGKTTLLHNIKSSLKADDIPFVEFDNLNDGGDHARSAAGYLEDFAFLATSMASSEGENIVMNLGRLAAKLRHFISTGEDDDKVNRLAKALSNLAGNKQEKEITTNERWILLDAIDSGLSVDNICEVKEYLFKTIFTDPENQDKEVYIIASANEYELASGENCLDVVNGKFVKFKNYDEYKELILASRKEKEQR
jgi:ABC-type cobalamin/Fe3+-siderophores transport system ATPase subunit